LAQLSGDTPGIATNRAPDRVEIQQTGKRRCAKSPGQFTSAKSDRSGNSRSQSDDGDFINAFTKVVQVHLSTERLPCLRIKSNERKASTNQSPRTAASVASPYDVVDEVLVENHSNKSERQLEFTLCRKTRHHDV
jgi:hypothetical protein